MIRLALVLISVITANAATLNSDGSASDTQTQINAASSGDTVLLPASGGPFTWSTTVTMGTSKYITLDLNGRSITLSGASGKLRVEAHATGNNKVVNGSIVKSGTGFSDFNGPFEIEDERGSAGIVIGNINFSGTGLTLADSTFISMNGRGPGVLYECSFTTMGWADEFIHIDGWGPGVKTGWTVDTGDDLAGSDQIFYFEDNTFVGDGGPDGVSWIQSYYGARSCMRFNSFDWVTVDSHGTAGNIGARWFECYGNVFDNNTSSGQPDYAFSMRAATGIICSNSMAMGAGQVVNIGLCEEDTGYPALWQVGRGISLVGSNPTSGSDLALDPTYVWENGTMNLLLNACDGEAKPNMIELDRDVYEEPRPDWTALTYPHPLRGAVSSGTIGNAVGYTARVGSIRSP